MNLKLKKMREDRHDKITRFDEIMADAESRDFTNEEKTEIETLQSSISQLNKDIKLIEGASEVRASVVGIETPKGMVDVSDQEKRHSIGLIGLTEQEKEKFSITRLTRHLMDKTDSKLREEAAFELEVSRAVADKRKQSPQGAFLAHDVLLRDANKGVATEGGHLVGTDNRGQNFIDVLRASSHVIGRAQILDGLVGDVTVPRLDSGSAAYVVDEGGAPTEGAPVFGQVPLKPHTVAAYVDVTRKLLMQSSIGVDNLLMHDLIKSIALKFEALSIYGSGVEEPLGIINTSGIGSVAIGANGGALSWDTLVDLETGVDADNALIRDLLYLTTPQARGQGKKQEKAAGTGRFLIENNEANGYPVLGSTLVPSNGTKGTGTNLSSIIFGNFSDAVVGLWSGIDINIDESALSTSGGKRIVAMQDADYAVRRPQSFAVATDIDTAL